MPAGGEGAADSLDPGSLRQVASVPLLGELQLTGEGPPLPAGAAGEAAGSGHADPEWGKAPSGPPSRRGFVPPERRSGWLQTAVVLLSELVGSGVLALPFALARLGWVPGLVLVLALALLNLYSGVLLWRLHLLVPTVGVTYGDLAGAVGGPLARATVFAVAYCYFFALQIVYLLTAAECLQVALFWVERCLYWYTLAAFAVLLALSQCRSLHAISYLGVLSSAAVLLSVVVLLVDSLSTWNARAAVDIEAFATGVSFQDAFAAGVSILFLYAGQGLYPEIMAEMQVPEMFGKSLYASSGVMVAFYLSAGVPMYFRYGSSVSGNLLYSMPKGWMRTVAGLAMAFHVAVRWVAARSAPGNKSALTHHPHPQLRDRHPDCRKGAARPPRARHGQRGRLLAGRVALAGHHVHDGRPCLRVGVQHSLLQPALVHHRVSLHVAARAGVPGGPVDPGVAATGGTGRAPRGEGALLGDGGPLRGPDGGWRDDLHPGPRRPVEDLR